MKHALTSLHGGLQCLGHIELKRLATRLLTEVSPNGSATWSCSYSYVQYVGDTSHSVQGTDKTLDDTKPLGREAAEHILNISEFKPHEPCACHTSCDRKGVEGLVVIESMRMNKRGTFALPLEVWP